MCKLQPCWQEDVKYIFSAYFSLILGYFTPIVIFQGLTSNLLTNPSYLLPWWLHDTVLGMWFPDVAWADVSILSTVSVTDGRRVFVASSVCDQLLPHRSSPHETVIPSEYFYIYFWFIVVSFGLGEWSVISGRISRVIRRVTCLCQEERQPSCLISLLN